MTTAGRFNTCGAAMGLPTVTATFVSGNSSAIVNGVLVSQNNSDSTILDFTVSNIRWNQSPGNLWFHGIFFPLASGIELTGNSLGAGWLGKSFCTGSSCSGHLTGGYGYYYDGISSQSCCNSATANDNNPSNNWGSSALTCTAPFSVSFRMTLKNYLIYGSPVVIKLRGSSDGATGCWSMPDASLHTIQFEFPTSVGTPTTLCNPVGNINFSSDVSGSTYQWQMSIDSVNFANISDDANYTNTNGNSLSLVNIPSSWYGREYRCMADGSNYSAIKILKFQNIWTGAVNNDWNTAGNWGCGYVPDMFTDAVIYSGTVTVGANVSVGSLTTFPGVVFTVNPGVVFTVLH